MIKVATRQDFFDYFEIKPEYLHEGCPQYAYVKGHELCVKNKDGKIDNKCEHVGIVYPEITYKRLLELIALASGYFQITFSFERGIEDIETAILTMLCNTDKELIGDGVRRIFKDY